MKAALVLLLSLWLGLIAQTTLIPYVFHLISEYLGLAFLEGKTIDLAFLFLAYLALHRNVLSALSWAVVLGLFTGSFGLAWPGCLAIAYFLTTLGCVSSRKNLLVTSSGSVMTVVFVLSLIQGFLHLQAATWIYSLDGVFSQHWGTWLTQAFMNAAFAPLVFEVLAKIDEQFGDSAFLGSRRSLIDL